MADRFGASSLTALLAVAGMVGLGVAGFRAFSGPADAASIAEDACPLMGEDCTITVSAKSSCCATEAECDDVLAADGELETCHGAASTECKDLKDGCTGDGENGCCGAGEDGTGCEDKTGCEEKAAACTEKPAECSEVAEKPKACCSQKDN